MFVSYHVAALFTNVPLDEAINILANRAFTDDWVNKTYGLFQFDMQLFEQTDGVAMGSPLGPLMANVFICHLEEQLARDGLMPLLYRRCVDDTIVRMPDTDTAIEFLTTLNGLDSSLTFTMELPENGMIPFIGIEIIKNGTKIETQVYRKATNTGLLLHFQSHTDKFYEDNATSRLCAVF